MNKSIGHSIWQSDPLCIVGLQRFIFYSLQPCSHYKERVYNTVHACATVRCILSQVIRVPSSV